MPLASQPPIDRPKAQLNGWGPGDSGSSASFWLLEVGGLYLSSFALLSAFRFAGAESLLLPVRSRICVIEGGCLAIYVGISFFLGSAEPMVERQGGQQCVYSAQSPQSPHVSQQAFGWLCLAFQGPPGNARFPPFASPILLAVNTKDFKKFLTGWRPQGQSPSISSRKQKAFRRHILTPWSQAVVGLDSCSVQSIVLQDRYVPFLC